MLSSQYGNRGVELAKKAVYNLYKEEMSTKDALNFVAKRISKYAVEYYGDLKEDSMFNKVKLTKYKEITSEILALNEYNSSDFTREYVDLLLGGAKHA